jgi:ketosteroid isomerase-like protein
MFDMYQTQAPAPAAGTAEAEALAIAKAMFARYVLGDTAGLNELFHPEAHVVIPGDPSIVTWGGTWTGADVHVFHQRVKDAADLLEYVVEAFEPHGDTVIAHARERARVKATGKLFINRHVGVVTVRDGRIVRYLEYGDTAAMENAFRE